MRVSWVSTLTKLNLDVFLHGNCVAVHTEPQNLKTPKPPQNIRREGTNMHMQEQGFSELPQNLKGSLPMTESF